MNRRTNRRTTQRWVTAVAAMALLGGLQAATAGEAAADRDRNQNQERTPTSGGDDIGAVVVNEDHNGSGTPMTPTSDSSWTPPVCWFAPKYTNKELIKANQEWADEGPIEGIDHETHENRIEETDRYKDKEGMWWERTPQLSPRSCDISELWVWVGPTEPGPEEDLIDEETLAGIAYERTRLPAPPLQLRPGPGRQIVNLETLGKFSEPLDRVWVTASLNYPGVIDIAATTIAEPKSLRIDAGTEYAEPSSCTYDLTKGAGGYKVDTKGADCNITYNKAGDYTLEASIVWDVSWTATADPDGPREAEPDLPDGLSTYEEAVTVREIQTVID